MMLRVCPACQRRRSGYVEPTCDICAGIGVLQMGDAALTRHGPDVTARAVEIGLESAARFALAAPDMTPDACHQALADCTVSLRKAGILARKPLDPIAHLPMIARVPIEPAIFRTLDAPPLLWHREDRPVAAGIPGFSAAGYIARLSRAADPLNLLGPSTAERADSWDQVDRKALYLAAAAASLV